MHLSNEAGPPRIELCSGTQSQLANACAPVASPLPPSRTASACLGCPLAKCPGATLPLWHTPRWPRRVARPRIVRSGAGEHGLASALALQAFILTVRQAASGPPSNCCSGPASWAAGRSKNGASSLPRGSPNLAATQASGLPCWPTWRPCAPGQGAPASSQTLRSSTVRSSWLVRCICRQLAQEQAELQLESLGCWVWQRSGNRAGTSESTAALGPPRPAREPSSCA